MPLVPSVASEGMVTVGTVASVVGAVVGTVVGAVVGAVVDGAVVEGAVVMSPLPFRQPAIRPTTRIKGSTQRIKCFIFIPPAIMIALVVSHHPGDLDSQFLLK